jgi:DNA-binding transcriptional regulator GbsR (MarR family)
MGTRWGVNRTVAQIHALLYLAPAPLAAEEIARTLSVARSNVSASLRELQSWGVIRTVHILGDRRAHFEGIKDVWELFRIVLEERERREVEPTRTLLRDCLAELERSGAEDAHTSKRLRDMLDFFETVTACYEQVRRLPTPALIRLVRMGGKIRRVLGITR